MPFFKYKARSVDGKTVSGLVEAPVKEQAVKLLKEKQLFVITITEVSDQIFSSLIIKFRKVSFTDIVNFTRQLSTMVMAGLSIPESLVILREQSTNPVFTTILTDIERQIIGGGNLATALSKYPSYFSPIYVSLVRAGETSGMLDTVLTRLAETLEKQREFRGTVVGAMIYPIIIVIGMIIVVTVMMIVVMPKLTDLYKDFNITLPFTTQLLIGMSHFMVRFWWLMIIGGFVLVTGFTRWRKTATGEYLIDSAVLRLPVFGELQKKIILVDFTRTFAMLISSGIHVLDALRTLKGSLGNVLFRNAIEDIAKKVEKGFPMGDTFAAHREFPPIVSQMMRVGEETGKLDDTLLKLSTYFQTETEHLVKGLTTAIEPMMMVVLGLGVGFIVISIITPIYSLTSQFK